MHLRSMSLRAAVAAALSVCCLHVQAAPVASAPVASAVDGDIATRVEALRKTDPAAALALGQPAWQAANDKAAQVALGLALVDAAGDAHKLDTVVEIGSVLGAEATLTPEQRARLLRQLNGAIKITRDPARIAALESMTASLELALPGDRRIAELWRQLGASYYIIGAQDDALRVAKLALSKVVSHPDETEFHAHQIIMAVSAQQGRLPEAVEALLEVERVSEALGMPADPALLQNGTGLFVYTEDWDRAIDYGKRALAAFDAQTRPHPELVRAELISNLGAAYLGAEQWTLAETTFRDALTSARETGASPVSALNNLAHVLRTRGRPREALPLLQEAAVLVEDAGDHGQAATVYSNIGALQVDLGDRQAAAIAFDRSRELFTQSDNVPRRLELYPRMIDNLDALGRHREALALMREFKTVNDETVTVESKTRIAELESAVDLARKEGELADVERARADEHAAFAALQTREQRQRGIVWALLAALLGLAALVVVKVREGRARRRINEELARKNVEIEAQHQELQQLTATIRRQSEEDALTGLRNRRFVKTWLDARVVAQANASTPEPVLVALLDIDHFKRVNDLLGHEGGDHALMHFGDLLRDCARASDVVARWGGEEFLWICPGSTMSDAPALFRRLRERLQAEPLVRPDGRVVLSVSIGFALFPLWPGRGGDWAQSLRVADAALYRAKHEGRDRWIGFVAGDVDVAGDDAGDVPVDVLEAQGRLRRVGGSGDAATGQVRDPVTG